MKADPDLAQTLQGIFDLLPLEQAMPELTPRSSTHQTAADLVGALNAPEVVLCALFLYVDDLDRSHTISQGIDTPTGSYWHAIMHRREGDFSNAKYWYRRVGVHPAMEQVGYDPFTFTDDCQADKGQNSPKLVEVQRREWKALFDYCMREIGIG